MAKTTAEVMTTNTIGTKPYSIPQLRKMVLESRRKSQRRSKRLPVATAVACDPKTGVTLTMEDGCRVFIPLAEFHELHGATDRELREVVLRFKGHTIEWPQLDMQFPVCETVAELFGMKFLMAEQFGRRGGQTKSPAKTAASRANGLKGGRPRNKVAVS